MKLLIGAGCIASLLLTVVGVSSLSKVALLRRDVAMCIWALASAVGLTLGGYFFHLRGRIAVLQRAPRPPKPLEF
jgi:hypothetical protein